MSLQHLDLLLERLISEKLSEGNLRFRHNKVAGLEGIPCGTKKLVFSNGSESKLPASIINGFSIMKNPQNDLKVIKIHPVLAEIDADLARGVPISKGCPGPGGGSRGPKI